MNAAGTELSCVLVPPLHAFLPPKGANTHSVTAVSTPLGVRVK